MVRPSPQNVIPGPEDLSLMILPSLYLKQSKLGTIVFCGGESYPVVHEFNKLKLRASDC